MARRVTLVSSLLLVLLLSSAAPAAADWVQWAGDAGRTGHAGEKALSSLDLALGLALPVDSDRFDQAVMPVVIGDDAYLMTAAEPGNVFVARVWHLDLAIGQPTLLIEREYPDGTAFGATPSLSAAGNTLLIVASGQVVAFDRHTGAELWAVSLDLPGNALIRQTPTGEGNQLGLPAPALCAPPAVDARFVYVGCSGMTPAVFDWTVWASAIDLADGTIVWTWYKDAAASQEPTAEQLDLYFDLLFKPLVRLEQIVAGVSLVGEHVFLIYYERPQDLSFGVRPVVTGTNSGIWAIDATTGTSPWSHGNTIAGLEHVLIAADPNARPNIPPPPTGNDVAMYAELGSMRSKLLSEIGQTSWTETQQLRRGQDYEGDPGSGFGLTEDALYATTLDALHRLDHGLGVQWILPLTEGEFWAAGPVVTAGDRVYGRIGVEGLPFDDLATIDERSGDIIDRFTLPAGAEYALSDGRLVILGSDGTLQVLGTTPGSIHPRLSVSSDRPDPGELVTVDMSATVAGALGPATEFRADWGDGTVTEWMASPVLPHRFDLPQDFTATFWARNANQTSSMGYTFHVGQADEQLNLFQQAFAQEHQDLTFGVLGILLAIGGALFGLTRVQRRRKLLRRELEALETIYRETRDNPRECEAALIERRAHVRNLLVDGRLDQTESAAILTRIDELQSKLRLGQLDERLAYLPYGLVEQLRDTLADGRVSEWEHRHFVDALARDTLLTQDQKDQVRSLIDSWFARDTGT